MANMSFAGRANATGAHTALTPAGIATDSALFLKVFSGEILTAFAESNVTRGLVTTRTIQNGKSAQFPVTGKATAKFHRAGDSLIDTSGALSQIGHQEKVINIDNMLVSSTMIAQIEELKNHYDLRSIYATELGRALAVRSDIQALKTMIAAGLTTTANITTPSSGTGTIITGATVTNAAGLISALFSVAESLDGKDVPTDDRFAILTPNQYYTLLTSDNAAINKDTANASNADVAKGRIMEIAGIKLYKSNHLAPLFVDVGAQPEADDVKAANEPFSGTVVNNDDLGYNADLATMVNSTRNGFVAGHPSMAGCVKLLDLATESEYLTEFQGTLFVAKLATGYGVLRPEASVVVKPA
jgi:hypothetical protein